MVCHCRGGHQDRLWIAVYSCCCRTKSRRTPSLADSGSTAPSTNPPHPKTVTVSPPPRFFVILARYFHFRPRILFAETLIRLLTWYPPCAIIMLPLIGRPLSQSGVFFISISTSQASSYLEFHPSMLYNHSKDYGPLFR